MESLNKNVVSSICQLLEGVAIPSSRISKALLSLVKDKNILIPLVHGSRVSYRLPLEEKERFCDIVKCRYQINCDLDDLKIFLQRDDLSRAELVHITGNSKSQKRKTWQGIIVNSYHDIDAELCGKNININLSDGIAPFIYGYESLLIPSDIIVIGIENPENFFNIDKQKYLFDKIFPNKKILFASRYPQECVSYLRDWLLSIPNAYVHFGDFDLEGIKIYLSQFKKYLGDRASFLVPNDIEEKIKTGNKLLFNKQNQSKEYFENINESKLNKLINLIFKYKKGYEQEGYIDTDTI